MDVRWLQIVTILRPMMSSVDYMFVVADRLHMSQYLNTTV